jgi:hypothetical protein
MKFCAQIRNSIPRYETALFSFHFMSRVWNFIPRLKM